MKRHLRAYSFVIFASVTLSAAAAFAGNCEDLAWSKDRLSTFDAAVASGPEAAKKPALVKQASEIDAAIASLEQDIASRKGDAAAKGEAVLKDLRAGRDAYRAKLTQPVTQVMSAATADAGHAADETATALWDKVDAYLDAVGADLSSRQAAALSRFVGN
jgi:hypothetical protein